jgi:hypothetical protein
LNLYFICCLLVCPTCLSEVGIRYFFPYSLIRYFNAAIRYRYSATFLNFAIRYRFSLFATSFDQWDWL